MLRHFVTSYLDIYQASQMKLNCVLYRCLSRSAVCFVSSVTLKALRVEQVCKLLDHCNLAPLQDVVKRKGLTGAVLTSGVDCEADLTTVGLESAHARALFRHLQEWKLVGLPADFCADVKFNTPVDLQGLRVNFSRACCNDNDAVERLKQAADTGNHIAQGYLSIWHWLEYVEDAQSEDKARMYAMQALPQIKVDADKGCPYANYILGECLCFGICIRTNKEEACSRYKLAVDAGNIDAIRELGWCYDYGHGVPRDKAKAFRLYNKAADLGDPVAQFNLGICYENGEGVQGNNAQATRYYALAAAQGHVNAKQYLQELENL